MKKDISVEEISKVISSLKVYFKKLKIASSNRRRKIIVVEDLAA